GADDRVLVDDVEEGREPVDVVHRAGQRGRQVQAEAVDVHLGDPVAQRVHEQGQDGGTADVEGVPAAGVVGVPGPVAAVEPVVAAVVDALERQRGPGVVALGGVVVDDVEDHLDAGRVQLLDHRLELQHLTAAAAGGAVVGVGGEVAGGV